MFKFSLIVGLLLSSIAGFAQDVSRGTHFPTYDCSIFEYGNDRRDCRSLQSANFKRFENGGYAVSCLEFPDALSELCFELAEDLIERNDLINCNSAQNKEQCRFTRRGYEQGRFESNGIVSDRDDRRAPVIYTNEDPGINMCYSSYDAAQKRWQDQRRKAGQDNALTGLFLGGLGLLAGQSDDDFVRGAGAVMVVSGAYLVAKGLIQINNANEEMPHLRAGCSGAFRAERKRVIVERRECTSTRYTETNGRSSRSYYEVHCESTRYVTYERYDAWENSNAWLY